VQNYEKLSKMQKEKPFFFSFSRRSKFSKGKITHNFWILREKSGKSFVLFPLNRTFAHKTTGKLKS